MKAKAERTTKTTATTVAERLKNVQRENNGKN